MHRYSFMAAALAATSAAASDFGTKIHFRGDDELARQSGGALPAGAPVVGALPPYVAVPSAPASQYPPALPLVGSAARRAPPVANGLVSAPPAGCLDCNPGAAAAKNYGAGIPNVIVTFLHPYTNKAVTVPMTMPVGKPKLITRSDRIIYDYGSFGLLGKWITVRFHPDGTVTVHYR